MPRVTVLMAVHNGEAFLPATLASLASQTLRDFELLVVDDASTDGTAQILTDAARSDDRIRVLQNAQNLGLTRSLNVGLGEARGDFIARLDADDLADPQRLEIQAGFLQENPDHVLVGACEQVIDSDGRKLRKGRGGLAHVPFRYLSLFVPPIVHSSACFRRSTLVEHGLTYDENCRTAQDFEFWQRLQHYGKACRLPQVLTCLRQHGASISSARKGEQGVSAIAISTQALASRCPAIAQSRLGELAAFIITGGCPADRPAYEMIDTAFAAEAQFMQQMDCTAADRKVLRAITVNQLLKGASRFADGRHAQLIVWTSQLFAHRPLTTAQEIASMVMRRWS